MSAEKNLAQNTGDELSRRHMLWRTGGGLGGIALAWMLGRDAIAQQSPQTLMGAPIAPHYAPRAKRIVQVFCGGGVSHLETFDYKPALERLHGKKHEGNHENQGFFGQPGLLMKSPFKFAQRGQSGQWVSDLLPNIAGVADELAIIRSMNADSNNHTPAIFQMNTGFTLNGFPCMGSWLSYGLGSECDDLPSFVVLPDPRGKPAGGSINWTAGFLPANHQGVPFNTAAGAEPIADLVTPADVPPARRQAAMQFLRSMNQQFAQSDPGDTALTARIHAYELAARMQLSVPGVMDITGESQATLAMYGMDRPETAGIGRNCLVARRLLERGVRFVQIWSGGAFGSPRINWDGHENIVENHTQMALSTDKPAAALIADLKARGMLDDTLFVFATEFGRGPATQGINSTGRDHHPKAFTCFLAGAGVKRGIGYGASDDVGYYTVENPVTIPDFHATILHLLGLDHQRLTYYHNGIQRRLTNVHGEIVRGVLV